MTHSIRTLNGRSRTGTMRKLMEEITFSPVKLPRRTDWKYELRTKGH